MKKAKNDKFLLNSISFGIILAMILVLSKINRLESLSIRVSIVAILTILIGIVYLNVEKITNLSKDNPKVRIYKKLSILNILILISFTFLCEFRYIDKDNPDRIIVIIISIFLMYFGNVAPTIPRNRNLGLRLPWTVYNEEAWRAGHKLLGYISFPMGILMIVVSYFLEEKAVIYIVLLWVIIPSIYSLIIYIKSYKKLL